MNIKIDLSDFVQDARRYVLMYIDFQTLEYVSDVIDHICNVLQLEIQSIFGVGELSFYNDIWYIPSRQSSYVLKEINGILRLCYLKKENRIVNSSSPPLNNSSKKQKKVKESSSNLNQGPLLEDELDSNKNNDNLFNEMPKEEYCKNEKAQISNKICTENQIYPTNTALNETMTKKSAILDFVNDVGPVVEAKPRSKCDNMNSIHSVETFVEDSSELVPQKIKKKKKHKTIINKSEILDFVKNDEPPIQSNSEVKHNINSICSTEDLVEDFVDLQIPQKTKRKRKHNKKKKSNEEVEECTIKRRKYNKMNNNICAEKKKEMFERSHIVFNGSDDDDSMSTPNLVAKRDSTSHTLNNTHTPQLHESHISHSTPALLSYNINKNANYKTKNDICKSTEEAFETSASREQTDLQIDTNNVSDDTHISSFSVGPDISTKCPPQLSNNNEELSSKTLSKFKKLLALEERFQLEVFRRDKNGSMNSNEGWDSLPLSFASRKEMRNKKQSNYLSINSCSYSSSNQRITVDNSGNEKPLTRASDDTTSTSEGKDSLLKEMHIGAKASRKTRYFQSVGNILNALKNPSSNNSNVTMKATKEDESKTSPHSFSSVAASPSFTIAGERKELKGGEGSLLSKYRTDDFDKNIDIKDHVNNHFISHESNTRKLYLEESIHDEFQFESGETKSVVDKEEESESCPVKNCMSEKLDLSGGEDERQEGKEEENNDIPVYDIKDETVFDDKENQEWRNISYESYPLLSTLPRIGDIIATKVLTLDENMCPHHSDYRPSEVISVDGLKLELQFLDVSNCLGTSQRPEDHKNSERYTVLDWRDLLSPRLIFP